MGQIVNRLSCFDRVALLLAIDGLHQFPKLSGGGSVIGDLLLSFPESTTGEVRPKWAGLHDTDMNIQRRDLLRQGLAEPFEGKFAGVVNAKARRCLDATV